MSDSHLKSLSSHFQFGKNWASFSNLLDAHRIASAEDSLRALIVGDIVGKSFLDIGSGSGLSSLAAARLGATPIRAIDIDPDSVATTTRVIKAYAPDLDFEARQCSVFDLAPADAGSFDVVHSWGVLHHTGAMWEAIAKAAALVKPEGLFVLAIYNKTPFCGFWRLEKRFYTKSPAWVRNILFHLYRSLAGLYALARLRNPWREARSYATERGMEQDHDIRDWLGGYPYESATPQEIDEFLAARGFRLEHSQNLKCRSGVMGTGCAEFTYRRTGD